ncbi:hypothetical protein ACKKBF_B03760 [Auxenochlorella protothecoides x Auxenochlorella symbiontica]
MVRIPAILSALVLLLARCAVAEGNCSSTFIALPSVMTARADAVCMHEGFSKAGSARTSTLHVMGLSMSAVRVSTLQILRPRSTKVIVAVECLKAGQKACSADKDGSIGYHNQGRNNFGTMNDGDDNIGNLQTCPPRNPHPTLKDISSPALRPEAPSPALPPPSA